MKKSVKKIAALALASVVLTTSGECALADTNTYPWEVSKMPGYTYATDEVYVPLYAGRLTYVVDRLFGSGNYVAGMCTTPKAVQYKYYIDCTNKKIEVTKPSTTSFKMHLSGEAFETGEKMTFYCSIESKPEENVINHVLTGEGSINIIK